MSVFLMSQQLVMSQSKSNETCDTPTSEPALDLNSITKCSIEDKKDSKTKQVSVEVTSRRRVIRKRDAVTGVGSSNTSHKLAALKKKASLVGNLDLSSEEIVDKVPFSLVEEIPLFSDCEKVAIYKQEKCFKEEISRHVKRYFRYPQKAYDNNVQGRVLVQFVIDKNGEVADLNLRGPYKGELLEKEAERIVRKLPKFRPGKHNGKAVKVKYGVPISFRIPGKKPSNIKPVTAKVALKDALKFSEVQAIPEFAACGSDNSLNCFNTELVKHIQKYFAYPQEAADKNIQGKVYAYFVIDKNGEVANVKTRGPKDGDLLEAAAKVLIQKLPTFKKPALINGTPANVKYTFPINFKLVE